ncbi:MAG: RagB/SusD family nutrient uptake outer membrane protein [Prevotella sp.]|jgi:hypothetical protein|nr:RagB/SusD family nutrient uptake outer membrane protein [Prevotella sp.]
MKKYIRIIFLAIFSLQVASCADYLDIVPDNTITLEDFFERKEMAWNALVKVYSYLPQDCYADQTSWTLGDEWMGRLDYDLMENRLMGMRIMRGLQNSSSPFLGHWTGSGGGKPLYQGIRSANTFLEYIDMVEDMTETEKKEWKAQVKFLKAYFHFLLLRQYGPIVIMDQSVPLDALSEDLFQKRSKVEDCFNYIINLMNEAIPDLQERTNLTELGLVDRLGAAAIRARVMLFRASPFYNGNSEYFGDFLDFDGKPFFNMQYDHERWKEAADAAEEAIALCRTNGTDRLYEYTGAVILADQDDYDANTEAMQALYNVRMSIVDPWNTELLWGLTHDYTASNTIACYTNMIIPQHENFERAEQWLCASYAMLERYYTKNGLPIDEDRTFTKSMMYDILTTPLAGDGKYTPMRGLMQPNELTVRLYLDREPRFYASLGINGGYWRAYAERAGTLMLRGTTGGPSSKAPDPEMYFSTGIGVQKFVHPESKAGSWAALVRYPYPIIRMADLYLMKAEALNEYLDSPNDEIYDAVDKVRLRAGLRGVKETWSDSETVRIAYLNKHRTKEGMKDIILRERSIELAFEGSRFWDMYRHKKAVAEFSAPIMGWKPLTTHVNEFFVLEAKQSRRFIVRDYLWPISLDETNKNANIIQNPGW